MAFSMEITMPSSAVESRFLEIPIGSGTGCYFKVNANAQLDVNWQGNGWSATWP